MRGAVVMVLVGVLLAGACGGGEDGASGTSAGSTTGSAGEPIVIETRVTVADASGAETIATGEVLGGSTIGGSPFCVGGSILDKHWNPDEESDGLFKRTVTCPDGTVTVGMTPEVGAPGEPQDQTQKGSWTIVSGTGAFEGLRGSGEMEVVYDPNDETMTRETLTGTTTR
jgi:hypothetical protein